MKLSDITAYADRMQEHAANLSTGYPTEWSTDDPVLAMLLTMQDTVVDWVNATYEQPYQGLFVRNIPWMVHDLLREQVDHVLVDVLCDLHEEQQELGDMTAISHATLVFLGWMLYHDQIDHVFPALHKLTTATHREQCPAQNMPAHRVLRKLLQVSFLNTVYDVLTEEANTPSDEPWAWREPLIAHRVVERLQNTTTYEPYDSVLDLVEQDMHLAFQIGQQQADHDEYNAMLYGGAFHNFEI